MDVLLTGGTGFLGSFVTRALLAQGHRVRVLVRAPIAAPPRHDSQVQFVMGDILAKSSLERAADGVQALVHCAGHVSLVPRDAAQVRRVNVLGTRNVVEVAARRSLRLLHTSSIAVLGPTSEPRPLDETAPVRPLAFDCPYAESKRESEALVLESARRGADALVLNPAILFGPGDGRYGSTALVRSYLRGELRFYLSGGASFCDVRDAAVAYASALLHGRSGERYILAGADRTYAALHDELWQLTGLHRARPVAARSLGWLAAWSELADSVVHHPYRDFNGATVRWGSSFNYASADKARRELDFHARPFTQTLADTVRDHLQRGVVRANTPALSRLLATAASVATEDPAAELAHEAFVARLD